MVVWSLRPRLLAALLLSILCFSLFGTTVGEEIVEALQGNNTSGTEINGNNATLLGETVVAEEVVVDEHGITETDSSNELTHSSSEHTAETGHGGEGSENGANFFEDAHNDEHEIPHAHAVLFPCVCLTIGVAVFYFLSRFCHAIPYTAVMFLIGTAMGVAAQLMSDQEDHLTESLQLWINIDSEVLLLIFLPGLIFKDSYGLNVHLFRVSFFQCFIFAFPMVLVGTFLTALIARFIFPYDWPWDLCCVFGAILSATDPVAVAALLEEVGAPPRLKVHISGEALLNDGAAIVFFAIFVARYIFLVTNGEEGEDVDVAKGFAMFFRMSLGGAAIGLAFGIGLVLIWYLLDRRFNREENVVEVVATVAIAYTGYYVAEVVCHTSGVIATLACGITLKMFGGAMINDSELLDSFWTLVEHILNSILFVLGGVVWGAIIAEGQQRRIFTAEDWGYLFLLYVLVTLVRLFLFAIVYPVTSRIGLKTNRYETIFQVYGGLRGAVGIALAIALDNGVEAYSERKREELGEESTFNPMYREQSETLFGMVGGIAFLTLVINGSTAGPFLRYLGLADATETRKKIVEAYESGFKRAAIDDMIRLLTQRRFRNVNFATVKHHVPYLKDTTRTQVLEAVMLHKESTPSDDYIPPYLRNILPYLPEDDVDEGTATHIVEEKAAKIRELLDELDPDKYDRKVQHEKRTQDRLKRRRRKSNMQHMMGGEPLSAKEFRTLFISLLRGSYELQTKRGELVDRELLAIALEQSLEFAADAVSNGESLQDWKYVNILDGLASSVVSRIQSKSCLRRTWEVMTGRETHGDIKYAIKRMKIERCLSFMAAHSSAQKFFQREFTTVAGELSESGKLVLAESQDQWKLAEALLNSYDPVDVEIVVSHKFCMILLNSGAHYIEHLVEVGLLKDDEAEHLMEEQIQHNIEHLLSCKEKDHPGEIHISEDQMPINPDHETKTIFESPEEASPEEP